MCIFHERDDQNTGELFPQENTLDYISTEPSTPRRNFSFPEDIIDHTPQNDSITHYTSIRPSPQHTRFSIPLYNMRFTKHAAPVFFYEGVLSHASCSIASTLSIISSWTTLLIDTTPLLVPSTIQKYSTSTTVRGSSPALASPIVSCMHRCDWIKPKSVYYFWGGSTLIVRQFVRDYICTRHKNLKFI